jgi:hypothetical protein
MLRGLFDPYRPERHYMRGPGPKCREKQSLGHRSEEKVNAGFARAGI